MTEQTPELEIDDPRELVGTTEAARILGVHPDTLKGYPIPFRRLVHGGRRRYALEDLRAFLADRAIEYPDP